MLSHIWKFALAWGVIGAIAPVVVNCFVSALTFNPIQ